jgi:hypothetical protein
MILFVSPIGGAPSAPQSIIPGTLQYKRNSERNTTMFVLILSLSTHLAAPNNHKWSQLNKLLANTLFSVADFLILLFVEQYRLKGTPGDSFPVCCLPTFLFVFLFLSPLPCPLFLLS